MTAGESRDQRGRRIGQRYPRLLDQLYATGLPGPNPLGDSSRMVRVPVEPGSIQNETAIVCASAHLFEVCTGPFIPRVKPGAFWPIFCKAGA